MMHVIIASSVEIKGMVMKTAQKILTYANLKNLWQQHCSCQRKNKTNELVVQFDLCNDLVICKDGKGLTSVVWHDKEGTIGSLVKYVPAISEWNDLDE